MSTPGSQIIKSPSAEIADRSGEPDRVPTGEPPSEHDRLEGQLVPSLDGQDNLAADTGGLTRHQLVALDTLPREGMVMGTFARSLRVSTRAATAMADRLTRVPQLASGRAPEKPEKGGVFVEMRVEGRVTTGLGAELGLGQAAAGLKS